MLWLGSTVFDRARAFEAVTPDLDRHYARVNQSAVSFGLKPIVDLDMWSGGRRMASVVACSSGNDVLFIYEAPIARSGGGGNVKL